MEAVNFEEVEVGGGQQERVSTRKTVSPGVDVFTITEAEVKENTNGKQYIAIKFDNKEGQYLKEQFYTTTPKALSRVKELATNSGVTLGTVTMDKVAALLIGNKVGLVVGGEKENSIIDGREVQTTRARIKSAYNFSFKAGELDKWKDAKIIIEDKTAPISSGLDAQQEDLQDLPF